MEEEAEKLKELQNEVEKQMNMSPPPGNGEYIGSCTCSPGLWVDCGRGVTGSVAFEARNVEAACRSNFSGPCCGHSPLCVLLTFVRHRLF